MAARTRRNSSPEMTPAKAQAATGAMTRKTLRRDNSDASTTARPKCPATKPQVLSAESSDKELAGAVALDDQRAWTILYNRWSSRLTRYGLNGGWDQELVNDIVQDTLVRAWDKRVTYNPQYPYNVWILTIFRRLIASSYRRRKIHAKTVDGSTAAGSDEPWWAENTTDLSGEMEGQDIREALIPVLNKLRPADRDLLTRWSEDHCQADLAREAGIKPVTLRTQVLRARARFRKAFIETYPDMAQSGWDGMHKPGSRESVDAEALVL